MLRLIKNSARRLDDASLLLAEKHHLEIVESYIQSHRARNHSESTVRDERNFINTWFKNHSDGFPLFAWDAMAPVSGRQLAQRYIKVLLESGISSKTVRRYLGSLNQFFSFVLEHPYVTVAGEYRRLQDLYGPIEKPLSEFDIPVHVTDTDAGLPMDPERLYEFLDVVREYYLKDASPVKQRNYTMAVVAAESGLRIDELLKIEIKRDLFFESQKIQTRFAKGAKGSGKRTRTTLFTPFAQDTVRYYLTHIRPQLSKKKKSEFLFITNQGDLVQYPSASQALCEMIATAQNAGFPVSDTLTWHWFRRIFSTRFIERFPDKLHILIELLGHMSMSTVHHYIRHSQAWMDKEVQGVLDSIGKH